MRNRILKEGFFRNYELAQLPPLARILFEGLWLMADKEGRLWDRPQQIKAECLPYDECDGDYLLEQLADSGFISRYESQGKKCIEVLNFAKHQTLTTWEKNNLTSDVPTPCKTRRTSKVKQTNNGSPTEEQQTDECRTSERAEQSVREQNGTEQREGSRDTKRRGSPSLPDDFVLDELQAKPAYAKLDVRHVFSKMSVWCEAKGKQPTRLRLINWLNREDQPLAAPRNGAKVGKPVEDFTDDPPMSEEEIAALIRECPNIGAEH